MLRPWFRRVLVANHGDKGQFPHASKRLCSNIGTARMVTEVFSEQFFVSVGSRKARLDRYLWNGNAPKPYLRIILRLIGLLRKELFFAMRYGCASLTQRKVENGAVQRILSFVTVVHGRVHA
jgi:hypothetical protein